MLDKDMTLGDYQAMLNKKVSLVNEEGAVIVKEAVLEGLTEDLKSYLVKIDGVLLFYMTDTVKLIPLINKDDDIGNFLTVIREDLEARFPDDTFTVSIVVSKMAALQIPQVSIEFEKLICLDSYYCWHSDSISYKCLDTALAKLIAAFCIACVERHIR